jgi:hypothetical protein
MQTIEQLTLNITADGWARKALRQFAYRTDAGIRRYRWCITCLGCGKWQWAMHFLGGERCDCTEHAEQVA